MPLGSPLGRPLRANAVASLAGTGHLSPAGRRPVGGAGQHAHLPGPAARPGPRPVSARQAAALNAQNARLQQEVAQTIAECQRAVAASNSQLQRRVQSLPFGQYDFDHRQPGRTDQQEAIQLPGTYRETEVTRYAAGGLWIYATSLHDGWGDRQYFVYNPQTGAILHFTPEASIAAEKRLYASRRTRIQGTAAGTGVAGGYMEKGFMVIAGGMAGGAVLLEMGGSAFVMEEALPAVQRTVVQAWQLTKPGLEAYGRQALKGMGTRIGTDLGIQVTSGALNSHGTFMERGKQVASGINGMSLVVAGVISTDGAQLSSAAKWLVAGGSAAAGNLVTVSQDNKTRYGGYWHGVDFSDFNQVDGFAFSVVVGAILDRSKEKLAEAVTEKVAHQVAQASGHTLQVSGRYLSIKRVPLGNAFGIGAAFDSGKKWLETKWGNYNEAITKDEQAKMARAQAPHRPAPAKPTR
ncbi:MAG: hypothetical protein EOO56_11110 [Hymenobacter sp.]|nr:MAG: hypothetical protein EOO56_11110 [Hymenobacter sp.]